MMSAMPAPPVPPLPPALQAETKDPSQTAIASSVVPAARSSSGIVEWADADAVIGLGFARAERDPYIPGSDVLLNSADDHILHASLDKPIGAECRGHKLLLKMGWVVGTGLGKNKQGRLEPIVLREESTGLGLGKSSEYDTKIKEVTASRKLLSTEVAETAEEKAKREVAGARLDQTKTDVKEMNKSFYCEDCDKQYKTVSEFANHLSSYDHHHTKVSSTCIQIYR
jgi:G-patch domain/Zinc-finger double-stranded RNA-binding